MKKIMIVLIAVSLTVGGCMRPMNAMRPPHEQRANRKHVPPPTAQPGPDRRPNPY
ncbi:hypothetical protein [Spirosoma validum]|uniref:Lipoprotein n=1 Tax=Spirosoma validum TaxID=2771355 RepID=A0A927AXS7_9BACT|nr:hypothetical protein [Spirosoma validum]MBD2751652.1 hypothetical protein [Spirosoma validum]